MLKDDKDIYVHQHHPEAFRNHSLNKLHESDEFLDLYKDWIQTIKNKFTEKYIEKDKM